VNLSHWVPPIGFGLQPAARVEIVCILSDNITIQKLNLIMTRTFLFAVTFRSDCLLI